MPFQFKPYEDLSRYEGFGSVLIIPCRFCPAASSAVKENRPYIELFRRFMKTDSYERFIAAFKSRLEQNGIRVGIFKSRWIHQFVLCMWTSKRRKKLVERARDFDALIIFGCEGATQTVRDSLPTSSSNIFQGLVTEGLMSIKPRFRLPCNITLQLESVSPVLFRESEQKSEAPSLRLHSA